MTTDGLDSFSYFTTWSLLINYSVFIWTLFLGCPKWLFLFSACFLTTTSVLGTFFLCLPNAKNEAEKRNITVSQVILEDTMIHTGPLVLFLLAFNVLSKNLTSQKINNWYYIKIFIACLIVIFSYLGYIKFQQVYYYDYFTLVILSACIFVSSFQIYSRIL